MKNERINDQSHALNLLTLTKSVILKTRKNIIMARTVGCSDFKEECAFRITADEGQEQMMVDVATDHAMKYHPAFAETEGEYRRAIRSKITELMIQAHLSPDDISELYANL